MIFFLYCCTHGHHHLNSFWPKENFLLQIINNAALQQKTKCYIHLNFIRVLSFKSLEYLYYSIVLKLRYYYSVHISSSKYYCMKTI